MKNEPQLSAEEEKIYQEFIKLFDIPTMTCEIDESQKRVVASLGVGIYRQALATALEEQRTEILNEVIGLISDSHIELTSSNVGVWEREIEQYNQALDDLDEELRAKLAQMKGKE